VSTPQSTSWQVDRLVGQARRLLLAWRTELGGLIPAGLRQRLRPALTAEPASEGRFRLSRGGRTISLAPGARGITPVTLRAPADMALVCETTTPDAPAPDIRGMVALDLDRLTPFESSEVFVGVGISPGVDSLGRRRVLVGAAPKGPILALIGQARAAGIEPRAVEIAHASRGWPPVDLTPALSERLGRARGPMLTRLWLLAALLGALDIAVVVARDVRATDVLRAQAQALRPRILEDERLRSRVLQEEARRSAILQARAAGEPLRVLDVLSRALPDGAWADHLSWNGDVAHISGSRSPGLDVTAALRASGELIDVRSAATDVASGPAGGLPFDASARLRRARAAR
jgi:general secretion pathway protein L